MAADSMVSQMHRRMVESGEWDKTLAALLQRLSEVGWLDELEEKAKGHARDAIQFKDLQAVLDNQAQSSVPLNLKQETVALIKAFVEKQID